MNEKQKKELIAFLKSAQSNLDAAMDYLDSQDDLDLAVYEAHYDMIAEQWNAIQNMIINYSTN